MMIVSFFVFFNYVLGLLKAKYNAKSCPESDACDSSPKSDVAKLVFEGEAEYEGSRVHFFPPVYIQRYRAVVDVLQCHRLKGSIKKIIDVGCAELSFFSYIKRLEGVEEYLAVDIDGENLLNNYTKVAPLTADYLSKRCTPLKVTVLKGSVVEPDLRLKDTNAVIAIELIEHMYPNELNDLPYNIFGVIHPEIAIFTTPNSDFNVLFKRLERFRHPDHKFEWSRSEFENWANNLTLQYPNYEVSFHGIGKGPEGTEYLGCCSQMAVFQRKAGEVFSYDQEYSVLHECIYDIEYPFQTPEQKLNDILDYEVYHIISKLSENEEFLVGDRMEIPLEALIESISIECPVDKILEYLKKEEKDVQYINNKATLILPYYGLEDNFSSSYDDEYDYNYDCNDDSREKSSYDYWDIDFNYVSNSTMKSDEPEEESNSPENAFPSVCSYNVRNCNTSKEFIDWENSVEGWNDEMSECLNTESVGNNIQKEKDNSLLDIEQIKLANTTGESILKEAKMFLTGSIPQESDESAVSTVASSSLNARVLEKSDTLPFLENPAHTPFFLKATPTALKSSPLDISTSDFPSENFNTSSGIFQTPPTELLERKCDSSRQDNSISFPDKLVDDKTHPNDESLPIKSKLLNQTELARPQGEASQNSNSSSCTKEANIDQPSSSVQRCHSLENINVHNSKNQKFRYSLNIDNGHIDCDSSIVGKDLGLYGNNDCDTSVVDMDLEVFGKGSSIPSLTDTFGSHSKAPDSGYPNSTHDMDMDLTPEQVDEIITETESSLEDEESSADERVEPQVQGINPPVVFLDNVENGDVANNNRDGEGNNMEGGEVVEEILGFEGMGAEGGDVEAGPHESDDEGLYLSALDVSNETLVPEESSSLDPAAFNSAFDLPSSSSFLRPFELECNVQPQPIEQAEFPAWLLDILVNDINPAGGDAVDQRNQNSSSSSSSTSTDGSNSSLVEVILPGDNMGGGE